MIARRDCKRREVTVRGVEIDRISILETVPVLDGSTDASFAWTASCTAEGIRHPADGDDSTPTQCSIGIDSPQCPADKHATWATGTPQVSPTSTATTAASPRNVGTNVDMRRVGVDTRAI